jgi:hypothetical protein
MNERIKELEKLAYVTTEKQVRKGGWDNDREPYEYNTVVETTFSLEKFAELIIRKCADIGYDAVADGNSVLDSILEHFGVEE